MADQPGFVSEEPVAELGVVSVGIEDRVRQVGLDEFPVADRVGEPAVVGLAGKIEDPSPESRRRRARGQVGTSLSRQVRLGQIRRDAAPRSPVPTAAAIAEVTGPGASGRSRVVCSPSAHESTPEMAMASRVVEVKNASDARANSSGRMSRSITPPAAKAA